jgi:Holliday junction resolvase RusA-like endonuclease
MDIDFLINGEPASAKNQRRIVKIGGVSRLIKSKKALDYSKAFQKQCPRLDELIEGDVSLRIDVWYGSRRPDLACADLIMDLLQGYIYQNDRQVKGVMSLWNLDRENPRCRIRLKILKDGEGSQGLSSSRLSEIWGELESQD